MVYRKVSLDITPAQLRKAAAGKQITLSASQLRGGSTTFHVHPENALKIAKAKKAGRGTRVWIAPGAINHDLDVMQGGSVWSWLKGAAKSVYKFAKDNYDVIKPVLSRVADAAVPALATAIGQPALAIPARQALKSVSGVGLKTGGKLGKGTPEAKAHMAALRARKSGGSFRL